MRGVGREPFGHCAKSPPFTLCTVILSSSTRHAKRNLRLRTRADSSMLSRLNLVSRWRTSKHATENNNGYLQAPARLGVVHGGNGPDVETLELLASVSQPGEGVLEIRTTRRKRQRPQLVQRRRHDVAAVRSLAEVTRGKVQFRQLR
ncbi:hypothetical protein MTO96_029787 [Rhipicephalus appendiculatus]